MNFNEIYSENKTKVFNFILSRIGNREVSEELANDVFVKVAEFMEVFNPEKSKFQTWLYNIVRNRMIDYYRTAAKKSAKDEIMIGDYVNDNGVETLQIESDYYVDNIESSETMQKINKAFGILNKVEREIAELYILQDKQYKEIADILDVPIGTVKGNLNRARGKMQEYLKNIYVN